MSKQTDKDWIKWGKDDPYFAVLSSESFRKENMNDEIKKVFMDSGRVWIKDVFKTVESIYGPLKDGMCLDFGCGTGRFVLPMFDKFEKVIGIDISPQMLDETKVNSESVAGHRLGLYQSIDLVDRGEKVDFAHSYIVFQHIPKPQGMEIIKKICSLVKRNGVVAFHVVIDNKRPFKDKMLYNIRKYVPLFHNLINILKGRKFDNPLMQMNVYHLPDLLQIMVDEGFSNFNFEIDNHSGYISSYVYAQKING